MNFTKLDQWNPPQDWLKVKTLDTHTAGEPLRIITSGFPEIPGDSILTQRKNITRNLDHIRKILINEPRGHADMYGCILLPPVSPQADLGVIFFHNQGYSTMCGHAIIALTKVVLETGLFPAISPQTRIRFETPAGIVDAFAKIANNKISTIYFHNVPSFVLLRKKQIKLPELGEVEFDIAFGGAFYALVDSRKLDISCRLENVRKLISIGMLIKKRIMSEFPIKHPTEPELGFLYGVIFTDEPQNKANHSRNVCIFADGQVDRSPTGTGVSARLAMHYDRGEVKIGQRVKIESILGTIFTGSVIKTVDLNGIRAVIPRVEGNASITGSHEFYLDPEDPLGSGFIIR